MGGHEEFGALVSEYQGARGGETRVVAVLGEAFSGAAQTLRILTGKIEDEELRGGLLSAPQARRVLGRN